MIKTADFCSNLVHVFIKQIKCLYSVIAKFGGVDNNPERYLFFSVIKCGFNKFIFINNKDTLYLNKRFHFNLNLKVYRLCIYDF